MKYATRLEYEVCTLRSFERVSCNLLTNFHHVIDPNARRHLYNNAKRLVTVTKGKNIIFSSEALNALEIRSPHDLIAFGVSIGLNQAKAKECVTENCRRVLKRSGKILAEERS